MQRYINATRDHVVAICDMIKAEEGLGGADDLRVAVCYFIPLLSLAAYPFVCGMSFAELQGDDGNLLL